MILFIIFNNHTACLVGIIGVVLLQYGWYQEERWWRIFDNLMQTTRDKPLRTPDGNVLLRWMGKSEKEKNTK